MNPTFNEAELDFESDDYLQADLVPMKYRCKVVVDEKALTTGDGNFSNEELFLTLNDIVGFGTPEANKKLSVQLWHDTNLQISDGENIFLIYGPKPVMVEAMRRILHLNKQD